METKLNVAFFGTSDKSDEILESLKSNFNLAFILTKNDTAVGRDHSLEESGVKTWAKVNSIPYLCVDTLKDPSDRQIIDGLFKHKIQYVIVADFRFIIPDSIISRQEYKMINIHFSLLPAYRGASPMQFSILNGDKETGVTFQYLVKEMDKGPVISQTKLTLDETETKESLSGKLFGIAEKELPGVIKGIESGKLQPHGQDETKASYTYSKTNPKRTLIDKNDALINWSKTEVEIDRMVRAYYPWPIAWCFIEDLFSLDEGEKPDFAKSLRMKNKKNSGLRFKIYKSAVKNNRISPTLVQIEGNKIMTWEEFKNGYLIGI